METSIVERCDVCIVGGNIAGAYLAYLLRQSQIDVIVIEEHEKTGYPLQCAGIISQKLAKIVDFDQNIIKNRVELAQLISPDGTSLNIGNAEHPFVLDRSELDHGFYKKAKSDGARFFFNERFRTYRKIKCSGVKITTNKHTIYAKMIVGCDGPLSKIAKLNGVSHNFVYGMQVRAKYACPNNITKMYFDSKWREMFGWVIPEGNGICRIGLGCSHNPRQNFDFFLRKLGVKKENIHKKQGGIIPWGYIRDIAFDRTLLLGDAGCMVKATTGGGVVMLTTAAKTAAKAILKALQLNDFSEKFFVKYYERPLKHTIGLELKVHYLIRIMLTKFSARDFNWFFSMYESSKSFRDIIQKYADMDFPKRLVIKLLLNRDFLRFLIHMIARNLSTIPDIIHLLAGKYALHEKLKNH